MNKKKSTKPTKRAKSRGKVKDLDARNARRVKGGEGGIGPDHLKIPVRTL